MIVIHETASGFKNYFFFLMENDESSSHRRQQTSAPNPISLSIYPFNFAKLLSFDLMVKEGLGLLMKNSWEWDRFYL